MNLVDIVALALIALGSIHGFIRGLSGELSHLIGMLVAFIFGMWCKEPLGWGRSLCCYYHCSGYYLESSQHVHDCL